MAQRSMGVPAGPLAAYLGVRNENTEADREGLGILAKIQALKQAEAERNLAIKLRSDALSEQARHNRELERLAGQPRPRAEPSAISIGAGGTLIPDPTQMVDTPEQPKGYRRVSAAPKPAATGRPMAVIGPDGKPVLVAPSDAIGRQPYSPSIAGGGELKPETLAFTAKQYLSGDRQAVQGYARNATARIALQNAIVDEATKQRKTPQQVAALMADFAGIMAGSRTVGQRAANISLAATEAQEMLGIVKETSDKFSRTQFVPWNMALRAYETGTGSPEIAEFGAAVNALVNVYARAINPTGVPTVSDKEHARAVLNTIQSQAQVDAVLKIINRELEIAKKAPGTVRKATSESIAPTAPTPPDASGAFDDPEKERRYQEWKARQK